MPVSEGFEGGSNGGNISSGNSSFTGTSSTPPTYSSAQKHSGSLSGYFTASSSQCYAWHDEGGNAVQYVRLYTYCTGYPGANTYILGTRVNGGSGSNLTDMRVQSSTGYVAIRNGYTAKATSDVGLTTNGWSRIEWKIDNTNQVQQLRMFVGANVDGSTPDYDSGNVDYTQSADVGRFTWGFSTTSTWSIYLDDLESSRTGWVGPSSQSHSQTPLDSMGLTDAVTPSIGRGLAPSDSMGLTDAIAIARGLGLVISDGMGLGDAVSHTQDYRPTIQDGIGISDAVDVSGSGAVQVSETLGLTDSIIISRTLSLADNVGLSDSIILKEGGDSHPVSLQEDMGITDGSATPVTEGQQTDPMGLADTITVSKITGSVFVVNITDDMGLTEPPGGFVSYEETIQESLGLADSIAAPKAVVRQDSIGLSDAVIVDFTPSVGAGLFLEDAIRLTDLVSIDHVVSAAHTLTIVDRADLTDTLSATLDTATGSSLSMSDTINFSDEITVTVVVGQNLVRLKFPFGIPQGRIDDWFWRHFKLVPQPPQAALLVYPDGTVVETDNLLSEEARAAPFVAGGGHETLLDPDSWQAQVLANAGYELEPVT